MLESLDIWKLLAGLGIFLFGMFLMEESVKNLAGKSFKTFIRKTTSGTLRSILSGTLVTALLQSSSAVSLMVLAFVSAGIMAMENAIGVILGSNIGTTFTAWIVAFFGFKVEIEEYAMPLIGIGGLGLILLGNSVRYSNVSKLMVGFGFLFMGLDYMKQSVDAFAAQFEMSTLPHFGIFTYALAGLLLTAIMQSSSATVAIILTSLNAGVFDFNAAAAMVIGANVGTTVTVVLGSIGGPQVKKRVALSHVIFNVVTAIVGMVVLPYMSWFINRLIGDVSANAVMGVALFHTLFNVMGVLLFLPFIGLFSQELKKMFPDKVRRTTRFIQHVTPEVSDAAIAALKQETLHLIQNVIRHNMRALNVPEAALVDATHQVELPEDESFSYEDLKLLQAEIFSFASNVLTGELSHEESNVINKLLHAARMALHSAKSIKDEIHHFEEFDTSDNAFLNAENTRFRTRLIKLYKRVLVLLNENDHAEIAVTITKILKKLNKQDRKFIQEVTEATAKGLIHDMDISTMLLVNRAFNQSSKQLIFAIREVLLSAADLEILERLEEEQPDQEL